MSKPTLSYGSWSYNSQTQHYYQPVTCTSGQFELFFVVYTVSSPWYYYCYYPVAPSNPPPPLTFGPSPCYWCCCPIDASTGNALPLFSILPVKFRSSDLITCLPFFPPPDCSGTPAHYPPNGTDPMDPLQSTLPSGVSPP
jgi:hypothetical protein